MPAPITRPFSSPLATALIFLAVSRGVPAADPPGGLAIIAPDRFREALAPYLRHKSKQMPAELLSLEEVVQNQDFLPVVISAGCSTARFATLPPYEAYVDVAGREHAGTDHGEVFDEPPPPPAPYQSGKFNPTGLGEGLLRRGPGGAVAYIGCNTGSQPCGLSLVEGFVGGLDGLAEPRLGDLWSRAITHYFRKERLADLKPTPDWYPPSIFFQGMKFMVFGDPSLLLPAPKAGRKF